MLKRLRLIYQEMSAKTRWEKSMETRVLEIRKGILNKNDEIAREVARSVACVRAVDD